MNQHTKEGLLEAVQGRLRERIVVDTRARIGDNPDLAMAARAVWQRVSHPGMDAGAHPQPAGM